jgi:NAD(P)-dependent dehydrogenase (short-subunit alcohol dehydrogenase family)
MSMRGKQVFITGGTNGIGRATAMELARQGADLTLLVRSRERAAELLQDIATRTQAPVPQVLVADLGDLSSVRVAAESYLATGKPLDVLVNNAGLMNTLRCESADGYEETFAVNHLAPFLLTGLLLPALQASSGARIVNVSSDAHALFCRSMQFEDLQSELGYKPFNVYGRSKLANILFSRELAARLETTRITVNSLHPGAVDTGLGRQNPGVIVGMLARFVALFFKSPSRGAATSIYLSTSAQVSDVSGQYFVNCRQAQPKPWAEDDLAAQQLWKVSEQLTHFAYPDIHG